MKNIIIPFVIFFILGMVIGMLIFPKYEIHGPNAAKEISRIYFDKKTKKCYRLGVKIVDCP